MEAQSRRSRSAPTGRPRTAVPSGRPAWDGERPAGPAAAVVDERGVLVGWTQMSERMLGHRADEVVGRSVAMLMADEDAAGPVARWSRLARAGRRWCGTVCLRAKDGTTVKADIETSPMSGDHSGYWFVTAVDPSGVSAWPPAGVPVAAALLARSPVALSIWDTDLRCIWLNSAAARLDGTLGRRRLGQLVTELPLGTAGPGITGAMRQVLETGRPVIEREYTWQVPGEDHERRLTASYFRIEGPDGRPLGVCTMSTDIETSRVRQHLLALAEMGGRVGTTLDVGRTAQELADAVVPLLADYATVDLAESVPFGHEPPLERLQTSPDSLPIFRRAGAASSRNGMPEAIWSIGDPVFVPPSSPFTRALYSGRTHFEPVLDTSPGTWLDQDPRRAERIAQLGIHSLVIVPIRASGTILGEAIFVRHDNRAPFTRDDRMLFEELVGRAALSLDNARRYTREHTAALALQRDLLPGKLSGGPGVELSSRYLPSDIHEGVGGDWFDVVPLPDARVGLVIGDVVGHGINAAALMGQLRTVTATLADLDLPPEEVLARLDRRAGLMNDRSSGNDALGRVMACTCAYVVYDPVECRCAIASAGHPLPALVRPDGDVVFPDVPTGPPIGVGAMSYDSLTVPVPAGSIIALYTDGLIETRDADLDAGMERLRAALRGPSTSLDAFSSHVISFMTPQAWRDAAPSLVAGPDRGPGTVSGQDDIALLLARTRPVSPEHAAAQCRP
ncbi:SpoIIE family protein phosphatase [Actinacidiphila acidipaludis]|uniref:SpoIIE family protein phosphatase n=1 Tax=Actinacidiphila acidipaludis TaxID=2873382 RepID=A0ABS7QA94_9ACTN|nr:SpoIIE family protein phosphatase [Streptomyces acidipaludis]MBY8880090.1 SpoIIE family protein phosphatase [Streptomyces acidipaludis]